MTKRLFLIFMLTLVIFLTGCGKENKEKLRQNFINDTSSLKGYYMEGVLSITNNDDTYNYDVKVGFKKDDNKLTTSISGILLFGLTVSLDALSVGIGLSAINNIYIIDALTFSICAFIFTFTGLEIGNIINNKIGEYSKLLGGIVLTLLGIIIYFN